MYWLLTRVRPVWGSYSHAFQRLPLNSVEHYPVIVLCYLQNIDFSLGLLPGIFSTILHDFDIFLIFLLMGKVQIDTWDSS